MVEYHKRVGAGGFSTFYSTKSGFIFEMCNILLTKIIKKCNKLGIKLNKISFKKLLWKTKL